MDEIDGTFVYFGDSSCNSIGSPGSLDASHGSTPDMFSQYNPASRSTISDNLFTVSADLADYVFATAGKGGLVPYTSSFTLGRDAIISQAPSSCQ